MTLINLDVELLHKISDYYDFPFAVFFLSKEKIPKGTRKTHIERQIEVFEQIREIIDDYNNNSKEKEE